MRRSAFSPAQHSRKKEMSRVMKKGRVGHNSCARIPLSGLPDLRRLPDQIAIQSHTPDKDNRQSPESRTSVRLLPPRAIIAHV